MVEEAVVMGVQVKGEGLGGNQEHYMRALGTVERKMEGYKATLTQVAVIVNAMIAPAVLHGVIKRITSRGK